MRQYNDFTDEELVIRARDGEEEITEYLMDKYKNLVRSKASTMFILGMLPVHWIAKRLGLMSRGSGSIRKTCCGASAQKKKCSHFLL